MGKVCTAQPRGDTGQFSLQIVKRIRKAGPIMQGLLRDRQEYWSCEFQESIRRFISLYVGKHTLQVLAKLRRMLAQLSDAISTKYNNCEGSETSTSDAAIK